MVFLIFYNTYNLLLFEIFIDSWCICYCTYLGKTKKKGKTSDDWSAPAILLSNSVKSDDLGRHLPSQIHEENPYFLSTITTTDFFWALIIYVVDMFLTIRLMVLSAGWLLTVSIAWFFVNIFHWLPILIKSLWRCSCIAYEAIWEMLWMALLKCGKVTKLSVLLEILKTA